MIFDEINVQSPAAAAFTAWHRRFAYVLLSLRITVFIASAGQCLLDAVIVEDTWMLALARERTLFVLKSTSNSPTLQLLCRVAGCQTEQ